MFIAGVAMKVSSFLFGVVAGDVCASVSFVALHVPERIADEAALASLAAVGVIALTVGFIWKAGSIACRGARTLRRQTQQGRKNQIG